MSKLRKGAVVLACSALLVWVTMSTAFAAGPKPGNIHPNDSGMYHICVGSTIHVQATYPGEVLFNGNIWNQCGDTINVTSTFRPSQVCLGVTSADPRTSTPLTITTTQVIPWHFDVIGDCLVCNTTTHKVTNAPNFNIQGLLQISGKTTLGELVKAADQGTSANVTNQFHVGDPC